MGKRGPKAVDRERLSFEAMRWANFLYTLRDGQGSMIEALGPEGSVRVTAPILSPQEPKQAWDASWRIIPAIPPNRTAWEKLKKARTQGEIRQATRDIGRWARRVERKDWTAFPQAICDHAKDLLRAKQMWTYPRDLQRRTSDDKRIVFLSKILAGSTVGLSPSYTVKRLAQLAWPLDKEWIQGPFVAMEKSFRDRIVDSLRKGKIR